MKARKLAEPTSWNFFAAIHGIDNIRWVWDLYKITGSGDADPGPGDTATYIDQCQHQSWYFLPWHRGYLLALENVLRDEIGKLGGPSDTWALPYWNYFAAGQNVLPPAFRSKNWPDRGDNPLFVEQRWGVLSGSTPLDVGSVTHLNAMGDPEFTIPVGSGNNGFGGPETGFSWDGQQSGEIEDDPHNIIHVLIGGRHGSQTFPPGTPADGIPLVGLMSNPALAALDPIFYLHHCNLDRLWESWNRQPPRGSGGQPADWQNPTDPRWLAGPVSTGERAFAMPNPDGSKWDYAPSGVLDIGALGYQYDDLTPGAIVTPPVSMAARMVSLGIPAAVTVTAGGGGVKKQPEVEMVGASEGGLSLAGSGAVSTSVRMEPEARDRLTMSLGGAAPEGKAPDRVFLKIERVTGLLDAVIFRVYVGAVRSATASAEPANLVGSVSLFGVSQASTNTGMHAGNGKTFTFEITNIVDKLYLSGDLDADRLSVDFVPFEEIAEAARIRIGRVSVFRQSE
ncbi:MAG: tyrosinase family protein [Pseudomonadota bacterium]|nr:tyrosinase family protein [Pseudomonadota bacterium]